MMYNISKTNLKQVLSPILWDEIHESVCEKVINSTILSVYHPIVHKLSHYEGNLWRLTK